jgi:NADPH:quinone reductase-like Zn-dependent oxidoreductase
MPVQPTMLALVLTQSGYAPEPPTLPIADFRPLLEVKTIPTPTPRPGQVLIRVRNASVNPSDIALVAGAYGTPRVTGRPGGLEGVGDVVASGGGLMGRGLVGRRVAFIAEGSGAWATYAVAPAKGCLALPKSVGDDDAAGLIVNGLSAWLLIDLVRRAGPAAFVMTAGASQLSKFTTVLAKRAGLKPILLVRRDEPVDALKQLGAAHVLNTSAPGFDDALSDVIQRERPAVFLDALANALSVKVFTVMPPRSRWVVYGGLDSAPPAHLPPVGEFVFGDKHVEGFWLVNWAAKTSLLKRMRSLWAVRSLFGSGILRTEVAARVPFSEAIARLPELLARPNAGKVLLVP